MESVTLIWRRAVEFEQTSDSNSTERIDCYSIPSRGYHEIDACFSRISPERRPFLAAGGGMGGQQEKRKRKNYFLPSGLVALEMMDHVR